ncbi:MAG: 50S ribosomal protein L32e [Desulfurococcales archaeon]|nr:50S ribosomal protein L32e [Desulfurococcales archaeon]
MSTIPPSRIRKIRARKRKFVRYLAWRFWKLGRKESWRKPKGNDNKMRLQVKGYPPIVKVGYRTPKDIRGLHPSGRRIVIIQGFKDLDRVNPETDIAVIASAVGLKLKLRILEEAEKRGIRVANPGVRL